MIEWDHLDRADYFGILKITEFKVQSKFSVVKFQSVHIKYIWTSNNEKQRTLHLEVDGVFLTVNIRSFSLFFREKNTATNNL